MESQNLTVQEAYLRQALADSSPALFEICADMMDPHGQSRKMLPVEFFANVRRSVGKTGFPRDRLFTGINNINPSLGKDESVESALKNT